MRRWLSIARATALEVISEPLSLLLLLTALALSTLAPAFHYHQFGEASRMARDAGFSALFTCGMCFAVLGAVRSFRREIETGTAQMALAHSISRTAFFLAKTLGVVFASALFSLTVFATALTIVNGAEIGGAAASNGDIARLWGPSLALGVATIVVPLAGGAFLNRFFRFRFVLTTFVLAFVLAVAGAFYRLDLSLAGRLLPVALLLLLPTAVLLTAAAALSVRFRANVAMSGVGILLVAGLPVAGNYYLPDALAKGGSLPWSYVAVAAGSVAPAVVAFLVLGVLFANQRDFG